MSSASAMQLHILFATSFAWAASHQQPPTYHFRDPVSQQVLVCEQCPPGTAVRSHCRPDRPTECAPCPDSHFSEHWHWGDSCRHCTAVCKERQLVERECNGTHDRLCKCVPGHHLEVEFCVRHSACPPGSGVVLPGSPERNTLCEKCPKGYFSSVASAVEPCFPHRDCSALGMRALRAGTAARDAICEREDECFPGHAMCHTGTLLCEEIIFQFLGSKQLSTLQLDSLSDQLPGRKVDRRSVERMMKACGAQQGVLLLLRLWREQNRDQERLFGIIGGVSRCQRMLSRCASPGNLTPQDLRSVADSLPGNRVEDKDFQHVMQSCRPRQQLLQILYTWRIHNVEQDVDKALGHSLRRLRSRDVPRNLLKSLKNVSKILSGFFTEKMYEKLFFDMLKVSKSLTSQPNDD
uniref:Tumor necrosis factor receptor superfamily member 11B-like n=1 Tax=Paramormyrops kingsleyae TaxID=1676925 RepID=A0A3B3QUJ6_9TELE|nr:tumor necrosis factor receptor superfamily member 11B-like [Paramormyrops kingsleyae]